jgi:hypothetical protein
MVARQYPGRYSSTSLLLASASRRSSTAGVHRGTPRPARRTQRRRRPTHCSAPPAVVCRPSVQPPAPFRRERPPEPSARSRWPRSGLSAPGHRSRSLIDPPGHTGPARRRPPCGHRPRVCRACQRLRLSSHRRTGRGVGPCTCSRCPLRLTRRRATRSPRPVSQHPPEQACPCQTLVAISPYRDAADELSSS